MKKIIYLLIFCSFLNGCDVFKREYSNWEDLMDTSENQKGWFPPLFNDNILLKNNIINIILYYDIDTNRIWGKFNYLNDIINDLPIEINSYINNTFILNRVERNLKKIGFKSENIKLYFTENQIQHNRIWYYFIDTEENIIYFCNFFYNLGFYLNELEKTGMFP